MDYDASRHEKLRFLKCEFAMSAISASFQRNQIYEKTAGVEVRATLRNALRGHLRELEKDYSIKATDEAHERNIENLSKRLSDHPGVAGGRFRIGASQKVLNVYLKYLWCVGEIAEPPHCPFDGLVISALGLRSTWTALDNIEQYRELVRVARLHAAQQGLSLPAWELLHFNTIRQP
jgi:hypothetical protein